MNFEIIFFSLVAVSAIFSAVMMITRPNPMKGVLFLIVNFFCLAVLYLLLRAQFIAIIQILVYAGAIMVLFLFVIMLLNLEDEKTLAERKNVKRFVAIGLAACVLIEILISLNRWTEHSQSASPEDMAHRGTVEVIGKSLFTEYLFPFEITSMLLLSAMVGVIVLAKKKFK